MAYYLPGARFVSYYCSVSAFFAERFLEWTMDDKEKHHESATTY